MSKVVGDLASCDARGVEHARDVVTPVMRV
jgi:hypothetical protein